MEEQFDIQISYVELKEVDVAPSINKLITEGYVSKLTIREGGNYVFSYYTDGANTIDKYIKIKGELIPFYFGTTKHSISFPPALIA